ncbi:MAG: HK97 gp10 family phage protein [Acidimicrobiia bacterium]
MAMTTKVLSNEFAKFGTEVPVKVGLAVEAVAQNVVQAAKTASPDFMGVKAGWTVERRGGVFKRTVLNREWRAVFVEDGTPYLAAQPMLRPALERGRKSFEVLLAKVFDGR